MIRTGGLHFSAFFLGGPVAWHGRSVLFPPFIFTFIGGHDSHGDGFCLGWAWMVILVFREGIGQRGMGDGGRYPFAAIHFLGFSFSLLLFSGFHLDGSLDSVPPSAVLETRSLFLFPFSPTPQTMVQEARRFLAAGGALSSDHIPFLFCSLPQKYIFESGTRRTERNRLSRMHTFLVLIFRSLGLLTLSVFLLYIRIA